MPEGLEIRDVDSPTSEIDWLGTLLNGQTIIPGILTRRRMFGNSQGDTPEVLNRFDKFGSIADAM